VATHLNVTGSGTLSVADRLTKSLLDARGNTLAPARNGWPPRCSSTRAAYLLHEIGKERMKPFHAIDDVFDCCLQDGVPLSELTAILDQWRASLEARAVSRFMDQRNAVPLPTLLRTELVKETTAQGKADPAQERAMLDPENVAALESFAREGQRHYEQLGRSLAVTRTVIEVKRGTPRRVYGAKRPTLELSR
jgi:hypothetical protein